jgi:uncharacterized protein
VPDLPSQTPPARIPSPLQAVALWLVAGAAMLGAGFLVAMVALGLGALDGKDPLKLAADPNLSPLLTSPTWIAVATLVNEVALAFVLIVAMFLLKPSLRSVMPLRPARALAFVGAILAVFGLAPLADAAAELCQRVFESDVTAARLVATAAKGTTPLGLLLLVIAFGVMPALVEEAMFRGFVTAAFLRGRQIRWLGGASVQALVLPSLMFGLFHLEPTQVAGTIVLGFGFGAARLITGSLAPAMVAHGVYNTAVVIAVRHADDLPDEREIALVPIAVGLCITALGVVLMLREQRRPTHG